MMVVWICFEVCLARSAFSPHFSFLAYIFFNRLMVHGSWESFVIVIDERYAWRNGTERIGVFCIIRHGLWTDDTLFISLSSFPVFLSLFERRLLLALYLGMDDKFGECRLSTHLPSHALVAGWSASFGRLASGLLVCGAFCI
jgi:hypothetical protein